MENCLPYSSNLKLSSAKLFQFKESKNFLFGKELKRDSCGKFGTICETYKQMKGDNLSNQMVKFYNGYFSLTMPRSVWLRNVGTCDPHSRASFDPKDIIGTKLVEVH